MGTDLFELRMVHKRWTLCYVDHKGVSRMLATFVNGPLQRAMLLSALETGSRMKMTDTVRVEAPRDAIEALEASATTTVQLQLLRNSEEVAA